MEKKNVLVNCYKFGKELWLLAIVLEEFFNFLSRPPIRQTCLHRRPILQLQAGDGAALLLYVAEPQQAYADATAHATHLTNPFLLGGVKRLAHFHNSRYRLLRRAEEERHGALAGDEHDVCAVGELLSEVAPLVEADTLQKIQVALKGQSFVVLENRGALTDAAAVQEFEVRVGDGEWGRPGEWHHAPLQEPRPRCGRGRGSCGSRAVTTGGAQRA